MKKIYLCGPIMYCEGDEATDWRKKTRETLGVGYHLLDPMRRNFRDHEVDSANEIVEFDMQDIRDADIILVNYCKPSVGTSMEVFYASQNLGKFVVAFSHYEYQDCSPWMAKFCTKILPSLEDSWKYIQDHFPAE